MANTIAVHGADAKTVRTLRWVAIENPSPAACRILIVSTFYSLAASLVQWQQFAHLRLTIKKAFLE